MGPSHFCDGEGPRRNPLESGTWGPVCERFRFWGVSEGVAGPKTGWGRARNFHVFKDLEGLRAVPGFLTPRSRSQKPSYHPSAPESQGQCSRSGGVRVHFGPVKTRRRPWLFVVRYVT